MARMPLLAVPTAHDLSHGLFSCAVAKATAARGDGGGHYRNRLVCRVLSAHGKTLPAHGNLFGVGCSWQANTTVGDTTADTPHNSGEG